MEFIKKVTSNLYLGDHYKKYSLENDLYGELLNKLVDERYRDNVICILTYDNSTKQVPIFRENDNYIMTESGKTFEKLAY